MSDLIEVTAFCCECEQPVQPKVAYREVVAWERPGRGVGGRSGSSLVLRRNTNRYLCDRCVRLLRETGSAQQGVLAV